MFPHLFHSHAYDWLPVSHPCYRVRVGTTGYTLARDLTYPDHAVLLEVGIERDTANHVGGSTTFLSRVGPPLHVIDVDPRQVDWAGELGNVTAHLGLAEDVLRSWTLPLGCCWLDGHDWPYEHAPPGTWDAQEREYRARGQDYSRAASRASHLRVAELVEPHVVAGGLVIFDDTWALPSVLDPTPGPGWSGKGGAAVPYLLDRGFTVIASGDIYHGYVALRRD